MHLADELEGCEELLEANPLPTHPPEEVPVMAALCDTQPSERRVTVRPAAGGYPTRQFARLNAESVAAPIRGACVGLRIWVGFWGGEKR